VSGLRICVIDLFKPADRRAVEWAHGKGLKVCYYSCGDAKPFAPKLIKVSVDMLNPLMNV